MRLFILTVIVLCSSLSAYAEEVKMSSNPDKNKQLVRRIYEDCINSGKMELLTDLISEDYAGPNGQRGVAGFADNIAALRKGFPDIQFTIEDLVAENDRVTVRWHWKGTHSGPFAGFPASQNQVTNDGIAIYQVKDNKIIRSWLQTDRLGALQQMGILPKDLSSVRQASDPK